MRGHLAHGNTVTSIDGGCRCGDVGDVGRCGDVGMWVDVGMLGCGVMWGASTIGVGSTTQTLVTNRAEMQWIGSAP